MASRRRDDPAMMRLQTYRDVVRSLRTHAGATRRLHHLQVEHQQRLKAIRSLGMATMPSSAPHQ